jgi:hypothetical protein
MHAAATRITQLGFRASCWVVGVSCVVLGTPTVFFSLYISEGERKCRGTGWKFNDPPGEVFLVKLVRNHF